MVTALVDGMELGRATVRVTTVGEGAEEEFLRGVPWGNVWREDFPHLGQSTRLEWQQDQSKLRHYGCAVRERRMRRPALLL